MATRLVKVHHFRLFIPAILWPRAQEFELAVADAYGLLWQKAVEIRVDLKRVDGKPTRWIQYIGVEHGRSLQISKLERLEAQVRYLMESAWRAANGPTIKPPDNNRIG